MPFALELIEEKRKPVRGLFVLPSFKKCNKCGKLFPATTQYFRPQKGNKDGLRGECRECRKKYDQLWKTPEYKEKRAKEEIELLTAEVKRCTNCGKIFPRTSEYFYARTDSKYGFRNECKICTVDNRRKYVLENPELVAKNRRQYRFDNIEKFTEKDKRYREENHDAVVVRKKRYSIAHKEVIAAKQRKYYLDNIELLSENRRIYYRNNKERLAMANKQWRADHPEEQRITNEKRRSRIKNLPHTFTTKQWKEAKAYFNNKCAFCGAEAPLAMEHLVPVKKYGEFTRDNIVCACKSCNSSKNTKEWKTWFRKQPTYTLAKEQKILDYLGYKNGIQQLSLI